MKLVFVDIDGVLNSEDWFDLVEFYFGKSSFSQKKVDDIYRIDPRAVQRLSSFLSNRSDSIHLILSSNWRRERTLEHVNILLNMLGFDHSLISTTPVLMSPMRRVDEICRIVKHYLENGFSVESFAILEDHEPMYQFEKCTVRTDPQLGLVDSDLESLENILNSPIPVLAKDLLS